VRPRSIALSLALGFVLAGCPQPEPEPSAPDISGSYNLSTQQRDSTCAPETADAEQIFGFLDSTPGGIPVLALEIEQVEDQLDATLSPSGCVWTGLVDVAGAFTLAGDCSDADVGRIGRIGPSSPRSETSGTWTGP